MDFSELEQANERLVNDFCRDWGLRDAAALSQYLAEDLTYQIAPGQPLIDYPVLVRIPDSGFDCANQEYDGFFADTSEDARCQVNWTNLELKVHILTAIEN